MNSFYLLTEQSLEEMKKLLLLLLGCAVQVNTDRLFDVSDQCINSSFTCLWLCIVGHYQNCGQNNLFDPLRKSQNQVS